MKTCPKCGREIAQEGAFCLHCGEKLSAETSPDTSPSTPANPFSGLINIQKLDKKLIVKALVITSCALLALLFFTKWYTNEARTSQNSPWGSFSPLGRTMQAIQFKFPKEQVYVKTGENWIEGTTRNDGWGGTITEPGRHEPIGGEKNIVDIGYVIYDIVLSAFFIIALITLLKVIYNASRKKEYITQYNNALVMTIITCGIALLGSIILNNVERKIGYTPFYYGSQSPTEAFVTFKSNITMTTSFFFTAVIAIASRVFISHFYKEIIKK